MASLKLGIDTGGTYTDCVVYDENTRTVLGKGKSETTHDDLSIGIAGALDIAIDAAHIDPTDIDLVSMSTTLATNALVESKGQAACLVTIGFEEGALDRAGLREALDTDEVIRLDGGHDSHGNEVAPLDLAVLGAAVASVAAHVDAFAVTAQFSVRNPSHELAAERLIGDLTGKPVTCSHHLSANLNGPKRAVTALLNARLVAMIEGLVSTTLTTLRSRSIDAPLMVVRGDGSLVSAGYVLDRPIETILSGPAASIIGAAHLVGIADAVVSDIGGTTTDIAVLRDGEPELAADGAIVGGHRTMVEAVAMRTHGLGGDSQIRLAPRADGADLLIGPRRVIPVSLLAVHHHDLVNGVLERQLASDLPSDLDAVLVSAAALGDRTPLLTTQERAVFESLGTDVMAADTLATTGLRQRALDRLIGRGLVRASGFTPTDASHVLGRQQTYDPEAARQAATLFARQRDRFGRPIGDSAESISAAAVETLGRRSAEAVLAASFARDGLAAELAGSVLVGASLARTTSTTRIEIGLAVPLIGLGAPASVYYGDVADLLRTEAVIPEHADVANAVGAAVGRIRIRRRVVISAPKRGFFRVHAFPDPITVTELDDAKSLAREALAEQVGREMHDAGAKDFDVDEAWEETSVMIEGRSLFVEGVLSFSASGRPRVR